MSAVILIVLVVLAAGLWYASKNEAGIRGARVPDTKDAASARPTPAPVPAASRPTPVTSTSTVTPSSEPSSFSTQEQRDRQFEQRTA